MAILLTGIPAGIVPGFQNFTGPTLADQLRLNVAIPPSAHPNVNGILGGDLAGFPNGRRVFDDVVTVELRAVAGLTIPLVDPRFTPDGAAGLINDGTQVLGDVSYLDVFPYLDHPVERLRRAAVVGRVSYRRCTPIITTTSHDQHDHRHDHGLLEQITHTSTVVRHCSTLVATIGSDGRAHRLRSPR